MTKTKTNVEFVKSIMEFSDYGALAQAFVIDALSKWSEKIANADPKLFDSDFMNGAAWVGVAKEIKDKIDANYGRKGTS